jgi:hypothetical protein
MRRLVINGRDWSARRAAGPGALALRAFAAVAGGALVAGVLLLVVPLLVAVALAVAGMMLVLAVPVVVLCGRPSRGGGEGGRS